MREHLWRYFPAMLELENDLAAERLLDLLEAVPTSGKAAHAARQRSPRFPSAIASAGSMPPMCSSCCADRWQGSQLDMIHNVREANLNREVGALLHLICKPETFHFALTPVGKIT
jgi:hypothetical protein